MAERWLVLGGARSGKSELAEGLVASAAAVTYVATAAATDDEMAARIAAHQAARPEAWRTLETHDLVGAVRQAAGGAVLVDALGAWLTARMYAHDLWPPAEVATAALGDAERERVDALLDEADALWAAAGEHEGGPVVVVADETGMGVVPPNAATRRWVDLMGELNQRLAAGADRVVLAVAGRGLEIGTAPPRPVRPEAEQAPEPAAAAKPSGARDEPAAAQTPGVADAEPPGPPRAPARPSAPPAPAEPFPPADATDAEELEALRLHGDAMVPEGMVNLAVNVMPGGPPGHIAASLRAAAADVSAYPDDATTRETLAERHGIDPAAVLPTAGATDALWTLATALRPRRAAVIHPQFTEGEAALRANGCEVVRVYRDPEREWRWEPETVPDDVDMVLVGNPTNPLGGLDDPDDVLSLRQDGRLVVVDEAFVEFIVEESAVSLAALAADPGLVVVRTPTKLWAMPGVRTGYLLAAPALTARIDARRRPWAVDTVALAALRATAADDGYRRSVALRVADARDYLQRRLREVPAAALATEPAANFVCLRVPDGTLVRDRLRAHAIAVRPSTFPGLSSDHVRVAVHDNATTDRFISALGAALRSWSSGR